MTHDAAYADVQRGTDTVLYIYGSIYCHVFIHHTNYEIPSHVPTIILRHIHKTLWTAHAHQLGYYRCTMCLVVVADSRIMKTGLNRYCIAHTKWRISSSSHHLYLVVDLTMETDVSAITFAIIRHTNDKHGTVSSARSRENTVCIRLSTNRTGDVWSGSGNALHHKISMKKLYQTMNKLRHWHLNDYSNSHNTSITILKLT